MDRKKFWRPPTSGGRTRKTARVHLNRQRSRFPVPHPNRRPIATPRSRLDSGPNCAADTLETRRWLHEYLKSFDRHVRICRSIIPSTDGPLQSRSHRREHVELCPKRLATRTGTCGMHCISRCSRRSTPFSSTRTLRYPYERRNRTSTGKNRRCDWPSNFGGATKPRIVQNSQWHLGVMAAHCVRHPTESQSAGHWPAIRCGMAAHADRLWRSGSQYESD